MSFIIIGKTHGHNEETSIQFQEPANEEHGCPVHSMISNQT